VTSDRVPVQQIGALATLLVIWLLDWGGRRLPISGSGAAIGLFGMSSMLFGLSYLRADPTNLETRFGRQGALGLMAFSALSVVVLLLYGYLKIILKRFPQLVRWGGEYDI
jgi:hypothetical protein